MLKGMPGWMQTMNRMPGTTLTDMFDKAKRGRD
jgi:hypothetical protein